MSYDIYLCDPVTHEKLEMDNPHFIRGGTYAVGGTTMMWINITYNYGEPYYKHGFNIIDNLDGKMVADVMPEVERVISELKDNVDPDYWEPTEGNAKRALLGLLALMKMRPDAVICVD